MSRLKKYWELLNPKSKKYIKSFLKKMAIILDVMLFFIGFINFMDAVIVDGNWITSVLWFLFMSVFITIAWIYLETILKE